MDAGARPLGGSGIEVSRLALGSWRTFERLSRDVGLAVMHAARDAGITFLDDARYDDETGTAPIPTGYSEVLFGELFRKTGWRRDETIVANKLWWEFWPEQTAAAELDASLARMQFDYVDIIYANAPIGGLGLEELVTSTAGLITSGRARAWAIVNWPADLLLEASAIATRNGLPPPCAAQLPYSLVHRTEVEDDAMMRALDASGASVVASFVLAGGVLTGKYDNAPNAGRAAGSLQDPRIERAAQAARHHARRPRDRLHARQPRRRHRSVRRDLARTAEAERGCPRRGCAPRRRATACAPGDRDFRTSVIWSRLTPSLQPSAMPRFVAGAASSARVDTPTLAKM